MLSKPLRVVRGMQQILDASIRKNLREFEAVVGGVAGETIVNLETFLTLPPSLYHRYRNVLLKTSWGTTEIDHVFVSVFGIFVVETKNLSGDVFGTAGDRTWTQVFPGGRRFSFQNPLRQNDGHVRALQAFLGDLKLPASAFRSVVWFVGAARLRRPLPLNVVVGMGGSGYVRSFRVRVLSESEVKNVCARIETGRVASPGAARQHVQDLKRRWGGVS